MTETLLDAVQALAGTGADRQEMEAEIWKRFGCRRAVLVMDSTGFSRVTNSHGVIHYLLLLTRLRALVVSVLETHHASRVRTEADNIYAEFESPVNALAAAMDVNGTLHAENIMMTESEPFTLCMAIGFGDLLDAGTEGLYGPEMNLACKLGEDVAEGREILVTESACKALPATSTRGFEERFFGFSENSLRYFWCHWKP